MARTKKRETLDDIFLLKGLGRWQVSQLAKVSPNSITDWCNGTRKPQNAKIAALARALDVPIERVVAALEASAK